ncbi:hypothetical protein [Spirosoma spitsbergense]|uniref:hypothetical protein n=1 Tax=Spirosoma spitsbergense TaxID=431554 RepID=UPI00037E9219|nr:hypothetical protein [Spirosoma spitsbergense]
MNYRVQTSVLFRAFLFLFVVTLGSFAQAQQVPQGMKYQAVARSLSGEVLPNQPVTLKISLKSNGNSLQKTHYSETHTVTTNALGLFDLTIGSGKAGMGTFTGVPWSSEDIWMEIAIQDGAKSGFTTISSSRLLAVPYAFHAMTANELASNPKARVGAGAPTDGVPGNVWSTFGNTKTDPSTDRMGTMDYVDLIFVTNKTERLRITKDGDINLANSLSVGKDVSVGNDLNVRNNVNLNTNGTGATINNGSFKVANQKPTTLTGTLTVDGTTSLNNSLTVNNMAATRLTGTLLVEKDGTFKQKVVLDNAQLGSASTTTGALVVAGGVGIGQNLNVGGATQLNNTLSVAGATTLNNKLTVGAASDLNGQVTITADMPGTDQDNYGNYPLRVQGNDQGIAVKLTASTPLPGNNFITFFNSNGVAKGRIEGSSGIAQGLRAAVISLIGTPSFDDAFGASQSKDRPADQSIPGSAADFFTSDYAFGAYQQTLDLVGDIIRLITNIIGASGACITGDCDDVIWSAVDVAVGALQLGGYVAYNELQTGVAFESGGADYAEWLLKANTKETFLFGEVVGVKGGVVSKTFTDAEKFMVVSNAPAVIGGMPDKKKVALYEKIAFMGQVPVKVLGRVRKGDYILPSGKADGMAMAVTPINMSALDYHRVIGVAWADSDPKKAFSFINTAVGLNTNDLAATVDQMQTVINTMQLALQKAVPDYKPALFATSGKTQTTGSTGYSTAPSMREVIKNDIAKGGYTNVREAMQEVKQYMGAQGVDLSQYPYMSELLNNPTPEVAKKAQDHYMNVLVKAQALLAQQQKVSPMPR